MPDAISSSFQTESIGHESYEEQVGESCGEIDDFATGFDSFDETEADNSPGEEETEGGVPLYLSNIAQFVEGESLV